MGQGAVKSGSTDNSETHDKSAKDDKTPRESGDSDASIAGDRSTEPSKYQSSSKVPTPNLAFHIPRRPLSDGPPG